MIIHHFFRIDIQFLELQAQIAWRLMLGIAVTIGDDSPFSGGARDQFRVHAGVIAIAIDAEISQSHGHRRAGIGIEMQQPSPGYVTAVRCIHHFEAGEVAAALDHQTVEALRELNSKL